MEIIEGNKLIAEFMESKNVLGDSWDMFIKPDDLKFHTSWDWLMPVVEKIAKLGYRVKTNFNQVDNSVIIQHVTNSEQTLSIMYYSTPVEAIYTAVVQFIQWYNTQSKPTPQ